MRRSRNLNSNDKNEEEEKDTQTVINDEEGYVPPKILNGHNFKKFKSFNIIREGYKLNNSKQSFTKSLQNILIEYPVNDNDMNDELLLQVLNYSEGFFLQNNYKEREKIKKEAIFSIMKPYYRNEDKLLDNSINNLWHRVKKLSLFKRLCIRLKHFFSRIKLKIQQKLKL